MSRTIIIVAGCLGGSVRSIRCRGPALARRPHRAVVDASGDAGRAIGEEEEEAAAEGPTGLLQGSADPVSRRGASILLSAGCCLSSSQRCDDSAEDVGDVPCIGFGTTIRGEMSQREGGREGRSGFSDERIYRCNFAETSRAISEGGERR